MFIDRQETIRIDQAHCNIYKSTIIFKASAHIYRHTNRIKVLSASLDLTCSKFPINKQKKHIPNKYIEIDIIIPLKFLLQTDLAPHLASIIQELAP